jgi:dihydrodipicolinate synthase/N-acetylneuraminate lyase
MTNSAVLEGIVAIPVTPFDQQLNVDELSLRRQVEFIINSGVSGLLANVNASEWYTLSDEERLRAAEVIVGEASGQLPVFIGVTAQSTTSTIDFARHAEKIGAAGVNSMPPPHLQLSDEGCAAFYSQLCRAVDFPVILQNYYPPLGTPMSTETIARCVAGLDNLRYVKEETPPEPVKISELLSALEPSGVVEGVFGGQGGIYLPDELQRGVSGNMPACHVSDVLADVWGAWTRGDKEAALGLHGRLLPLMVFERCYGGGPVYKTVLAQRGVIRSTGTRGGTNGLDDLAQRELRRILSGIEDLFRI